MDRRLLRSSFAFVASAIRHLCRNGPIASVRKLSLIAGTDNAWLSGFIGHWKVVRVMSHPTTRVLARQQPQLLYRYVSENLATSFTKECRRDILINHYRFLTERVRRSFFEDLLGEPQVLWNTDIDGVRFSIRIAFTGEHNFDGDLLLTFCRQDAVLYQLAFTIVPGLVLGFEDSQVLFVARIQGARGERLVIREASRACQDVSLPQMLLAATCGLSEALGLKVIAGIDNGEALGTANIQYDYGDFWQAVGGEKCGGFYRLALPLMEKPLAEIERSHRRRTRLKRQFKAEIVLAVKERFMVRFAAV